MATFGKATFNAAKYASCRPTYPRQLYDFVFQFRESTKGARWDTALDIGCGTGQATVELTPFKRIIGVDPSAKMIEQARESVKTSHAGLDLSSQIEFIQSNAEDLKSIQEGSIDLIVSAQACHWFDWDKFWPEAARVLRKDGMFAAWGYSEFRLARYPSATSLISAYSQGSDPEKSLGPHWERPGRTIVDNHLLDVPDPLEAVPGKFSSFERVFFTGDHYLHLPNRRPVILRMDTTWAGLMGYLRTFSALHTFHGKYPEDLEREDGDIATRFWRRLKQEVASVDGTGVPNDEDPITIEWPLALILARRA
ncbi:S-adenosyl-L-methionine-dependent methyltransferase [Epithele typhae]|uniref:S-adenosyl-L-methionine-dependent methyltransferase n=1 Tax=Epithele typhae TaxID=378194 RepID=UPI002007634F|nr:S-adenosyl-L-methionine-dependent methyltransferase [Epithele typhae]KAH9919479.1 S-adenosyl-L-methionine-dependent methyltransferase [Epithele typhae]